MLIEKLNYIDYIYESIPNKYINNKVIYVYKKDKKWYYGSSFENLIAIASAELLLEELTAQHYDIDRLELFVDDIILNHCIILKKNLAKAMSFVTIEQIQNQEKAWERMMQVMMKMIKKDIMQKPSLKIVD